MAKDTKKKKKGKKKHSFIFILVILVIVGVLGVLYYTRESKSSQIVYVNYSDIVNEFNAIPSEVSSDISFDTIHSIANDNNNIEVKITSSNTSFMTNDGKVTQPLDTRGDVTIELTLNINCIKLSSLANFLIKDKVSVNTYTKAITIKARSLTNLELINYYFDEFNMPSTVYSDIYLPNKILSTNATWVSSDESILTNAGVIVSQGNVTLSCTLTLDDISYTKDYDINVLTEAVMYTDSFDFTKYTKSSYSGVGTLNNLEISNAISDSYKLKFRLEEELAYIKSSNIENLKQISFDYGFYGDDSSFTKDTRISLFIIDDNNNLTLVKEEILKDNLNHIFTYELDPVTLGSYKIMIDTDYSDKSKMVYITNLSVDTVNSNDDIIQSLDKIMPKSVNYDYVLPFTTLFGGKVTYESDSIYLDELGFVSISQNDEVVTLKATITGFGSPITKNYQVKVVGKTSKTPVEIRFIDISKFATSPTDCGESTYIKYGDYDILIDAGDNYNSTVESVKYVIDNYSNDKIIDLLIATHPDSDHIGGMDSIILDYEIKSAIRFNNDANSQIYRDFNTALENENAQVCLVNDSVNNLNGCKQRIDISSDGEVYIEIIDTTFYLDSDNNSRSVVCVLNAYGIRTLFTGDADNAKHDLEASYQAQVGNIDILKVVHHGTKNGTTLDFLRAVDPEVAIICNGNYFGNKHGHPTYEAISNLYEYDNKMLVYAIVGGDVDNCELGTSYKCEVTDITHDRNGTITIVIDGSGYAISSENYGTSPLEIKDTDFYKVRSALGK